MPPADETSNDDNNLQGKRRKREEPFQLGEWLVHPQLNRITGPTGSHLLEPKLMDLLVELASRPGRVFSRDELLRTVWDDVIVGEEVLTRGISELRRLLADDSRVPRYIETIRKGGYRIIAKRRAVPPTNLDSEEQQAARENEGAAGAAASTPAGIRRFPIRTLLVLGLAVIAVWVFRFLGGSGAGPAGDEQPWQPRPLTSYPGNEVTPALSPDGRLVAFSWSGPENDNYDIYVLQIGDSSPLRLTEEPAVDIHPVWSPDGMRLAYISDKGPGAEIRLVPVLGGTSRRLLSAPLGLGGGFSWSTDGASIVYATRKAEDSAYQLYLLDVESGEQRALAAAPPSGQDDREPEFSPDGRSIAFIRSHTSGFQDLLVIPVEGGDARCVKAGFMNVVGLDWTRSGRELLCSALYDGSFSLWRVDAASGEMSWSSVLGERIYTPSVARRVDRLAYHYYRSEQNIWRVGLTNISGSDLEPVVVSTHWEDEPGISPDGRLLAFISTRSGSTELWVSGSDGSMPHQITHFGRGLINRPTWSPDSRYIAFNASTMDHQEIYIAERDGNKLQRVNTKLENAFVSDWSNDGRWLYVSVEREGRWDICRLDLESTSDTVDVRVIARNAIRGYESTDGFFYYSRPYQAGLWRIALSQVGGRHEPGGEDHPWLPDIPRVERWNDWTVCGDHIFLLDVREQGTVLLWRDPESGRLIEKGALAELGSSTVTLSHDCEFCYFVRTEREDGDLMLVEGFR